MKKSEVKGTDVIHCETLNEFKRIIKLFKMDGEYLIWDVYKENTVLYPFSDKYGEVNGYCKEAGLNVLNSTEII